MPITQMLDPLPTPPSTSDSANFDARSDAFLGALPTFRSQVNTLTTQVNSTSQQVNADAAAALLYKTQADTSKSSAAVSEENARNSALSAAAFAQQAGLSVDVPAIIVTPNQINSSQAIPQGHNAVSVGPMLIGDGVTVEISENATWRII